MRRVAIKGFITTSPLRHHHTVYDEGASDLFWRYLGLIFCENSRLAKFFLHKAKTEGKKIYQKVWKIMTATHHTNAEGLVRHIVPHEDSLLDLGVDLHRQTPIQNPSKEARMLYILTDTHTDIHTYTHLKRDKEDEAPMQQGGQCVNRDLFKDKETYLTLA